MIFLNTSLGDLEIDGTISETFDARNTVPQHPVEFGTNISDHVIREPKVYTVDGVVTNTPFVIPENDIAQSLSGEELNRAEAAWDVLQAVKDSGVPFDVQTGLELIESVVFTGLNATRDKARANALFFRATLQEIVQVTVLDTTIPAAQLNTDETDKSSTVERGQVQGEEVTEESLLLKASKLLFGDD